MLPQTLPGLLEQDFPGSLHIVVVDDHSSDGTRELAERLAAAHDRGDRLQVVAAAPRPDGWAGKVWALREGLDAVAAHHPDYVLFTDADIAHPPDSLRRLVAAAHDHDLDVVSLMALLRCETGWERLVVPAFVYFFAQLYPFRWVNDPSRRVAAAAGGCLLVRTGALAAATDGLHRMKDALIDDVALAKLVKRGARGGRGRIWLGHTDAVVSRRPYPRLADLWDMVARSAYTQLRHSRLLVAMTAAGLLAGYVAPPLVGVAAAAATVRRPSRARAIAAVAGIAGYATMTATYLPMVRHYRLPARWALTLPGAAVLYLGMTVDSARRHARGEGGAWKGRTHAGEARG